MPTLLDTHAWVWWVTEDRRLSRSALRTIERDRAKDALSLSLISMWEVAKKVEKGQLVLNRPLDDWLELATHQPGRLPTHPITQFSTADICRGFP